MAAPATDGLRLWTDCFTKIAEHNRTILETFAQAASQETLDFVHHRMEQQSQLASRMQQAAGEIIGTQQEFAKKTTSDWVEQVHKLSRLYWRTVEDRVGQAGETVAAIIPFAQAETSRSSSRKAA